MKNLKIGNIASKPSNLIALMQIRQQVTSFEQQSQFVGENFKAISKVLNKEKTNA